jgi:hypothetical protein
VSVAAPERLMLASGAEVNFWLCALMASGEMTVDVNDVAVIYNLCWQLGNDHPRLRGALVEQAQEIVPGALEAGIYASMLRLSQALDLPMEVIQKALDKVFAQAEERS